MTPRHAFLALALAGTLAAVFWPMEEPNDVVEAMARPAQGPTPTRQAPVPGAAAVATPREAVRLGTPLRFAVADDAVNLFPAQNFRPPPKPAAPVTPPPPPPPMAPPLPFRYVGSWHENGRETVFLEQGEQVITTQAGATLPGGWRLDEVGPEGLTFTYVTLNQQKTLRIAP